MALRPSLKRRRRRSLNPDLILTPFIDILVALILFLLMTAIFGKASILNLYLPTEAQADSTQANPPEGGSLVPTIAVSKEGFILGKGGKGVDRIPLKEGQYDFRKLQEKLIELRGDPEASDNIIILPEARLRYQILITTMDTCREYKSAEGKSQALFPIVSLGEYRAQVSSSETSQP